MVRALLGRAGPLLATLAGQSAASATSFATSLLLGRFAGVEELGRFALAWTGAFLALSLLDTLVATPYTYFAARSAPAGRDLPAAAAWPLMGLAGVAMAGSLLVAAVAPVGLQAASLSLPLALACVCAREFLRRHWLAQGRATRVLRLDLAGAAVQLAALGWLASARQLSASTALWAIALGCLPGLVPIAVSGARWQRWWQARTAALAVAAQFAAYGRWLVVGSAGHVASQQGLAWLAWAWGGSPLAGLYAACATLANALAPVLTAMTNHFRPRFMATGARQPAALWAYCWRVAPLFVAPALALLVLVAVAGPQLLTALYGAGFASATSGMAGMALGMLALALAGPIQLALLGQGAPVTNVYFHGVALAGLLLGALVLQPWAGIAALGVTHAASWWAATAVLWLALRRLRPAGRPTSAG